jgi:hypothetical protein
MADQVRDPFYHTPELTVKRKKFKVGLIDRLDGRESTTKKLKKSRDSLLKKLGGEPDEGQKMMIELFVASAVILQNQAVDLLNGSVEKSESGKFTQALNGIVGLSKLLGFDPHSPSSLPWTEEQPVNNNNGNGSTKTFLPASDDSPANLEDK